MFWKKKLTKICAVGDLPADGGVGEFQAGARTLCVARLNGKIFALENECPHNGAPLGQGRLEEGKLICPWHAYAFDLATGVCDLDSALGVRSFEVSVAGSDVLVKL